MASGQQKAEENYQKFLAWMNDKTDDDYKQLVFRGQLSRQEIAAECDFGKSAINQNPRIKEALKTLENDLRQKGVLPEIVESQTPEKLLERDIDKSRNTLNSARLTKLEQKVTALLAENDSLKETLIKYQLLDEIITESGRMPR